MWPEDSFSSKTTSASKTSGAMFVRESKTVLLSTVGAVKVSFQTLSFREKNPETGVLY